MIFLRMSLFLFTLILCSYRLVAQDYSSKNLIRILDANFSYVSVYNDGNYIWVSNTTYDQTEMIDKTTFKTIFSVPVSFYYYTSDSKGNVWMAKQSSIFKYDGISLTPIQTDTVKFRASIHTICFDKNDNLWVCTLENGIFKYDGKHWTNLRYTQHPVYHIKLFGLAIDSIDNLWVTSELGLLKYNGTNWTLYDKTNSIIDYPNIRAVEIVIDKNNVKWMGGTGIIKFDDKEWTYYNKDNSNIPGNSNFNLYFDSKNYLWFRGRNGSSNAGITKYDGNNFKTLDFFNEPTDYINDIYIDRKDNLWISSKGVYIFNEDSINLSINDNYTKNFSIYPNPSSDKLYLTDIDGITNYTIYNLFGQIELQGIYNNYIDVKELINGMYFIRINNKETIKFFKQ